jgi:hypothetical protein
MSEIDQKAILDDYEKTNQKMAQERRRYALLQAAASICAATIERLSGEPTANPAMWVCVAEELLTEIERREK